MNSSPNFTRLSREKLNNSLHLFQDGRRWWIVTRYWEQEYPTTRSPAEYL